MALAVDPTGKRTLVIFEDGHMETPDHRRIGRHAVTSAGTVFSHDGRYFASIGGFKEKVLMTMRDDEQFCVWDWETKERVANSDSISGAAPDPRIRALAFGASSSQIFTALRSGQILKWSITLAGQVIPDGVVTAHRAEILSMRASYDGKLLAFATDDRNLVIHDLDKAKTRSFPSGAAPVGCLAFSRDSRWVAAGAANGVITIYSAGEGVAVLRVQCPKAIRSLEFSLDGSRLLALADDGVARLWSLPLHIEGTDATLSAFAEKVMGVNPGPDQRTSMKVHPRQLGEADREALGPLAKWAIFAASRSELTRAIPDWEPFFATVLSERLDAMIREAYALRPDDKGLQKALSEGQRR